MKLNRLNANVLDSKSANNLRGGADSAVCTCACRYQGQPGGSSTQANATANLGSSRPNPDIPPEIVVKPKPED